jgi:hypothetical protein
MKRHTSKNSIRLRTVLILPLLAVALYGFSDTEIVTRNSDEGTSPVTFAVQDKATPEMVAEYNGLARKYNAMSPANFLIIGAEVERLEYIYGMMTDDQKSNAEPFPEFPEPPPAPTVFQEGSVDTPPPPPPPGSPVASSHPSVWAAHDPERATSVAPQNAASTSEHAAHAAAPEIPDSPGAAVPPAPPDPLERIKELSETGAQFFYNDKPINAARALKIVRENKNLKIYILKGDSGTPQVKLSTTPDRM